MSDNTPPAGGAQPSRTLLREEVLGKIMSAILDGSLPPGHRLRDDELIDWLGTSRAPIREALTQLADMGLVEMAPNRFTKVATVSPRLYAESAAVWAALVSRGLYWGIRNFPADELPLLAQITEQMRTFDVDDFPNEPTPVDTFVGTILRHCSNVVLLESIAIHNPLMQLGVNTYKGFAEAGPISAYFETLTRRCREHDVDGLEREIRMFLSGPMRALAEKMTGYTEYDRYERSPDARPEG